MFHQLSVFKIARRLRDLKLCILLWKGDGAGTQWEHSETESIGVALKLSGPCRSVLLESQETSISPPLCWPKMSGAFQRLLLDLCLPEHWTQHFFVLSFFGVPFSSTPIFLWSLVISTCWPAIFSIGSPLTMVSLHMFASEALTMNLVNASTLAADAQEAFVADAPCFSRVCCTSYIVLVW